jgi:hypothetical protein
LWKPGADISAWIDRGATATQKDARALVAASLGRVAYLAALEFGQASACSGRAIVALGKKNAKQASVFALRLFDAASRKLAIDPLHAALAGTHAQLAAAALDQRADARKALARLQRDTTAAAAEERKKAKESLDRAAFGYVGHLLLQIVLSEAAARSGADSSIGGRLAAAYGRLAAMLPPDDAPPGDNSAAGYAKLAAALPEVDLVLGGLLTAADEAIALLPHHEKALGRLRRRLEQRALAHLYAGLSQNSPFASAWFHFLLADALFEKGAWDEALTRLRSGVGIVLQGCSDGAIGQCADYRQFASPDDWEKRSGYDAASDGEKYAVLMLIACRIDASSVLPKLALAELLNRLPTGRFAAECPRESPLHAIVGPAGSLTAAQHFATEALRRASARGSGLHRLAVVVARDTGLRGPPDDPGPALLDEGELALSQPETAYLIKLAGNSQEVLCAMLRDKSNRGEIVVRGILEPIALPECTPAPGEPGAGALPGEEP